MMPDAGTPNATLNADRAWLAYIPILTWNHDSESLLYL